jgi:hypothetical protein
VKELNMATTAKKKATPAKKPTPEKGYRDHLAGSRKGKVHELHDKQGAEAAWVLGKKLGLKENTLRSWFAAWKRAVIAEAIQRSARVSSGHTQWSRNRAA